MDYKNRKSKKDQNIEVNTMATVYGMVPPQSKRAEEDLLGKILLYPAEVMDRVTDVIENPRSFYVESHQRIFQAMLNLRSRSILPDLVSVVEELQRSEELDLVGGAYYVAKLTNSIMTSTNIEHMGKLIMDAFTSRELIRIGGEMISEAYQNNTDPYDLLDRSEASLYAISFKNIQAGYVSLCDASLVAIKRMESLRHLETDLTGVPTGLKCLDKLTGGWQNPDLIILAARPSVGKTALALNLARNAAASQKFIDHKKGVGFFSLEMSTLQLTQRLASAESEIYLEKIVRPYRLSEEELVNVCKLGFEKIASYNMHIDDTPALSIYQFRAKARAMVKKHNCGLIIIDYIQLMSGIQNGRADNREQEIAKISRDLKGLAKELDIPILALSQLSRDVEKRKEGKKMPVLSDLRESGAIEQDADIVMFMYRPEYYDIHVNEKGGNNNGETHIKFAKHRSGPLDTVKLRANLSIQKFTDPTDEKQEEDPFPIDRTGMPLQLAVGSKMSLEDQDDPLNDWNFNQ